ncbi:MAG TPA: DAK2 domain-containing protein [Bacillota bacterium]|nr:DAK2 domain-containing protein [Bacillota bacterium]
MAVSVLDGPALRRMIEAAALALDREKSAIDALNVFPVPDGDTGTNMALTVSSAVREMSAAGTDDVGGLAKAAAMGSLMGARGNSGVILSQLFRGFSREAEDRRTLTAVELASCLQAGVETAYKAVMKPAEGTILTVARLAGQAAMQAARRGHDLAAVLEAAYREAGRVLKRTPEMLPVLRDAGVVDAGGQGLVVIFRAYLDAFRGDRHEPAGAVATAEDLGLLATAWELDAIAFVYDTEALLIGERIDVEGLRSELADLGDSLLVVGDGSAVKVHIHTNHPGTVVERCLSHGVLRDVAVKNMREQYHAARGTPREMSKAVSVVAVAVGEGMSQIMRSLGADVVINGGQSMNPSTEEIVQALERTGASQVIVLPNNANILLTARQAAELAKTTAHVVPTRTVPQGVAALLAMSPAAEVKANLERMHRAAEQAISGEITYAVRQTRYRDLDIREGDVIGLVNEEIRSAGRHWREVLMDLLEGTVSPDHVILTVYYGQDLTAADAESVRESLVERFPNLEVEVYDGGQPLYYILFSLE